jgi:hypothetical protein
VSGKRLIQAAFAPLIALVLLTVGCSSAQQTQPTGATETAPATVGSTPAPTTPAGSPDPAIAGTTADPPDVDQSVSSPTTAFDATADPLETAANPVNTPAVPVDTVALPVDPAAAQGDSGDLGSGDGLMPTVIGRTLAQARGTMGPVDVVVTDLTGADIDGQDGQIVCRQSPEPDQPVAGQISLAVADTC